MSQKLLQQSSNLDKEYINSNNNLIMKNEEEIRNLKENNIILEKTIENINQEEMKEKQN